MDEAAHSAERKVAGRDLRPSGEIWVTTTDSLLMGLLAPLFKEFRNRYPDIVLDVAVANEMLNLTRREADVGIRPVNRPPENLIGRRLATVGQAIFCHRNLGLDEGQSIDLLSRQPWIGAGSRLQDSVLEQWMIQKKLSDACVFRVDTLVGLLSAVNEGLGLAALPCYLAETCPDIVQLSDPIPELNYDLWLLVHPDLPPLSA